MSAGVETISYFARRFGPCPICGRRSFANKSIYGHVVCRKCYHAFANRRRLAFLIDLFAISFLNAGLDRLLGPFLGNGLLGLSGQLAANLVVVAVFLVGFMKEGFAGQSPGKYLCGIQVLDVRTGRPISFLQSFKRNSVLLFVPIPIVGPFIGIFVIVSIATHVGSGYRIGDRFARTWVIWKRHRHLPVFGGNGLICEQCGYNLTGNVSGLCPECGTPLSTLNRRSLRLAAVSTPTSDVDDESLMPSTLATVPCTLRR